jgi:asparagine synthase (glutamine-hydrolysing)
MCGIAGFLRSGAPLAKGLDLLQSLQATLQHRGPDGSGIWLEETGGVQVGLAHRRLAIIDVEGGAQPMADVTQTLHIVFNGEIYNFAELRHELSAAGHVFRTQSDTEVLLNGYREWGVQILQRLNGMFAFALWDAARQQLFLARDRFGEKPLFIRREANGVCFASEIKALLTFPGYEKVPDEASFESYFTHRYVPAPATLFDGIEKLLPGECVVWRAGSVNKSTYYMRPDCVPRRPARAGNPIEQFRTHFAKAVESRMVSDVPFGAFLSGGLDSSAIVAAMSACSSLPVRTFSVGFAEQQYSELPFARDIADRFGTHHTEFVVTADDIRELLPRLTKFRDAPVAEPSDIALHILARHARESVKMVLSGEGSDELLGGYPKHVAERYLPYYHLLPEVVTDRLVPWMATRLPASQERLRIALRSAGIRQFERRMPAWFGTQVRKSWSDAAPPFGHAKPSSPLRNVLAYDQGSWLADNLLERGDRMTMAASIETRAPFLDHDLVAFISTLPDRWRLRKSILREAFRDILPDHVVRRRKVGFKLPVSEWFRSTLKDYLLEHLLSSNARPHAFMTRDQIAVVVQEHLNGKATHEKVLWTMLTFEIWRREYVERPN